MFKTIKEYLFNLFNFSDCIENKHLVSTPKMEHPRFTINILENPTSITQVTSPRIKKIENVLTTDSDSDPVEVKLRTQTESGIPVFEHNTEETKYVSFETKKKNHICLCRIIRYLFCSLTTTTLIVLIVKVGVNV